MNPPLIVTNIPFGYFKPDLRSVAPVGKVCGNKKASATEAKSFS
jgi:hypothetical protein